MEESPLCNLENRTEHGIQGINIGEYLCHSPERNCSYMRIIDGIKGKSFCAYEFVKSQSRVKPSP